MLDMYYQHCPSRESWSRTSKRCAQVLTLWLAAGFTSQTLIGRGPLRDSLATHSRHENHKEEPEESWLQRRVASQATLCCSSLLAGQLNRKARQLTRRIAWSLHLGWQRYSTGTLRSRMILFQGLSIAVDASAHPIRTRPHYRKVINAEAHSMQ